MIVMERKKVAAKSLSETSLGNEKTQVNFGAKKNDSLASVQYFATVLYCTGTRTDVRRRRKVCH